MGAAHKNGTLDYDSSGEVKKNRGTLFGGPFFKGLLIRL